MVAPTHPTHPDPGKHPRTSPPVPTHPRCAMRYHTNRPTSEFNVSAQKSPIYVFAYQIEAHCGVGWTASSEESRLNIYCESSFGISSKSINSLHAKSSCIIFFLNSTIVHRVRKAECNFYFTAALLLPLGPGIPILQRVHVNLLRTWCARACASQMER